MNSDMDIVLQPIGWVRSPIHDRDEAPKQGDEGAPDVWVEIERQFLPAMDGLRVGDEIMLITWLHQGGRGYLSVHPRGDVSRPKRGVFSTRSPDRPNPLGLHRVKIFQMCDEKMKVGPLEVLDGTPIVDIKSVLPSER